MSDAEIDARLYVDAGLEPGAEVPLSPAQAHYLRNVLRLMEGARLALFNGRDGEWAAGLIRLGKAGAVASCRRLLRPQESGPDLWLCCALVKRPRFDAIVEKAAELGAAALLPVLTRHTVVDRLNPARVAAQLVEAAEQCERLDVPRLENLRPLDRLLAEWPQDRPLIAALESGPVRPIAEVVRDLGPRPAAILTGPEGGFAQSELDALGRLPFVHAVGLGPRILRADTAALSALACWQALAGDWASGRPPGRFPIP